MGRHLLWRFGTGIMISGQAISRCVCLCVHVCAHARTHDLYNWLNLKHPLSLLCSFIIGCFNPQILLVFLTVHFRIMDSFTQQTVSLVAHWTIKIINLDIKIILSVLHPIFSLHHLHKNTIHYNQQFYSENFLIAPQLKRGLYCEPSLVLLQ